MIEDETRTALEAVDDTPATSRDDFAIFCELTDALEASLVPQTVLQISATLGWHNDVARRWLNALARNGGAFRASQNTGRKAGPVQFVYWRRKP